MDTELVELLRTVMKEELAPIHHRLDHVDQAILEVNVRLTKIETIVSQFQEDVSRLQVDVSHLQVDMNQDVKLIHDSHTSIHEIAGEHEIAIRTLKGNLG